ncbi:hypothetical protein BDW59DRAFT_36410 [Aspergillus cavernicola]|uniref:Zn(2)-C6 fungal-type domain-containing protein n=1 Tax=Aspergillus cavernicola TaxID=176166 RepID=A0ABR4HBE1_9EURO
MGSTRKRTHSGEADSNNQASATAIKKVKLTKDTTGKVKKVKVKVVKDAQQAGPIIESDTSANTAPAPEGGEDRDFSQIAWESIKFRRKYQCCDRCTVLNRKCGQEPQGCKRCVRANVKCRMTNRRSRATWVRGDPTPQHVQLEQEGLQAQIRSLSQQLNALTARLDGEPAQKHIGNLRLENEQLGAEVQEYRRLSIVSAATATIDSLMVSLASAPSPFVLSQLGPGPNPYNVSPRPDLSGSENGAANPMTLPEWAQPASMNPDPLMSREVSMGGAGDYFVGQPTPEAPAQDNLGREATLEDNVFSAALIEAVYGEQQAGNNAPAPPNTNVGNMDEDSFFDEMTWQ